MKTLKITEEGYQKLAAILQSAGTDFFPANANATLVGSGSPLDQGAQRYLTVYEKTSEKTWLKQMFSLEG